MKKFLTIFALLAVFSVNANAQDEAPAAAAEQNVEVQNDAPKPRVIKRKRVTYQRMENVPAAQKAKLDRERKLFEKLTPEQKDELKNEKLRHRSEVKRITGVEEINMPFDN